MKIQKYKHELDYSYALGATLTYDLMTSHPEIMICVYSSSKLIETESVDKLFALCRKYSVPCETNDKIFNILSPKGNCYVIGVFKKPDNKLSERDSHVVLVNPSDSGNLGSIIRTCAGFNINNLAVVRPGVDCWDPHTVRASMGAVFKINIEYFDKFDDYKSLFPSHNRYAFMLDASMTLDELTPTQPYSLIFGNEAAGLPKEFASFCSTVIIPQSNAIDSLNLSVAVGIAVYTSFVKSK